MALVNWVFAAVLLVTLILGVGLVFYVFLGSGDLVTLVLGLTFVGVSGAALREVHPSEVSVNSGAIGAVFLLALYAVAIGILAAWKLIGAVGPNAVAVIVALAALAVWLRTAR
jgi:hypothetical protein